jgi:hypothetical protein
MRGLAIVALGLVACTPNLFGEGSAGTSMGADDSGPTTGTMSTTSVDPSTTDASTSGTTAVDGTTAGSSTDASSGTTGTVLACGDALPPPGAGDCPSEPGGCSQCNEDGVCLFSCTGMNGICAGLTIDCPDDRPCDVLCNGPSACRNAVVSCPPGHDCKVECRGDQACGGMMIECGAGPCSLECGTHMASCFGLSFACGSNDSTVTCTDVQESPPVLMMEKGSTCACEALACVAAG